MKKFDNIAQLIKTKRTSEEVDLSQQQLSMLLGYKNGQFISNVERGLCSIPSNKLKMISKTLKITKEDLKATLIKDYESHLDQCFRG